ncbi:putative response regulatory protein [Ruminiclostridium hungatei]|uniref:Stage 0 sporulation protein A homolog n=2 Tax=Ruminiclostridium hungatei TaxID=48256 RepID=A0A1V4SJJ5_RUMHU|nr:putative response regulatory protein [Ruminiclostridium hungatei]
MEIQGGGVRNNCFISIDDNDVVQKNIPKLCARIYRMLYWIYMRQLTYKKQPTAFDLHNNPQFGGMYIMFRVFMVDDEPSVIEGLKIMIPWEEFDFELCGEASNGQDALMKIKKLHPHLIITDISMPGINGLELIYKVQKFDSDTEFVILSGYADFAYVQEAMRHKVLDYLLKPLDREEIVSILRKIKDKLDSKFLTLYGFSQSDIKTFKSRRTISDGFEADNQAGEEIGDVWKAVRENFDEDLTTAINLMNYEDAMKLIDELFDFFATKGMNISDASIMVNSCVYHILLIAYKRNIRINTILPSGTGNELDFDKLRNYITDILSQIINLMLEERKKNSKSYLYEVKTYIENNYIKELSVAQLAEMVFMEAGYLGDAFNKQFGYSISEFQHRLRIEKATELIETTNLKLSEISATVGYNNYNNFFSHFVRITDKKPTQYQRRQD